MSNIHDQAASYLTPLANDFWQWDDLGEVLVDQTGATICFRDELRVIVQRLALDRLPRFGALALLLAARRDAWPSYSAPPFSYAGESPDGDNVLLADRVRKRANAMFERVGRLESSDEVAELAAAVFESPAYYLPRDVTNRVTELLHEKLPAFIWDTSSFAEGSNEMFLDLQALDTQLQRLEDDRFDLRLRIETGLSGIVKSPTIEVPIHERVRGLLKTLRDDDGLSGVARLAEDLMSVVTLPRALSEPVDLAMGGVSDITNRGPLDRLLLTELANDDLTLAVRVAVNEALYLRRESPPSTTTQHRVVIMDAGIRTWGVPRLFVAAIGLAIAAAKTTDAQLDTFVVNDQGLKIVDLTTRDGLVAHLQEQGCHLHPGSVLQTDTITSATERSFDADAELQPIIVTTRDAFESDDFRRDLMETDLTTLYLAIVERDGGFELARYTSKGVRRLTRATLNLEDISSKRTSLRNHVDSSIATDLPAVFHIQPFPLRLPHPFSVKHVWSFGPYGTITKSFDGRLTHWTDRQMGPRELSSHVRKGPVWWSSIRESTFRIAIGFLDPSGIDLWSIDVAEGTLDTVTLEVESGTKHICGHEGHVFGIYLRYAARFCTDTGRLLEKLKLPDNVVHGRGRFFRDGIVWLALGFDGTRLRLEPVVSTNVAESSGFITVVERPDVDGPIGITTAGDLFFTANGKSINLRLRFKRNPVLVAVSSDERFVTLKHGNELTTIDVDDEGCFAGSLTEIELHRRLNSKIFQRTLTHRFRFIHLDPLSEKILMERANGNRVEICLADQGIRLTGSTDSIAIPGLEFCSTPAPENVNYQLKTATWPDGSRAVLDSRGVLHLQSSDTDLPEVSIILSEGMTSGWVNDGRTWGNPYFVEDPVRRAERDNIFRETIAAFIHQAEKAVQ